MFGLKAPDPGFHISARGLLANERVRVRGFSRLLFALDLALYLLSLFLLLSFLCFSIVFLRNRFRLSSGRLSSLVFLRRFTLLLSSLGLPGSTGLPAKTPSKIFTFLDLVFYRFLSVFGSLSGSVFHDFSMFLHHIFEHGFCIDFSWILG